ncbi:MAG: glycosyltransferase family 2 protein [Actinomycetota bacterium]|nr:glycosyltransferase family 2 protein [Actinomycetota bacterium]
MERSARHVAAIIPAFNEAGRIGAVIEELMKVDLLDEIIVVNDGSTDKTAEAAQLYDRVKVINRPTNEGKGAAIWTGIKSTEADILLLVDADLVGLKPQHIRDLVDPLLKGDGIDMTVGKFTKGRAATNFSQALVPNISGQRAFKRSFLTGMGDFSRSGFGVEIAFTKQAKEISAKVIEVPMASVTHVMKEEKLGIHKGFSERLKMYKDLLLHLLHLDNRKWD